MAALPKRFYRSRKNCIIAGVCGGIAEYFDADPTIIRLVFLLLAFAYSVGFWLYLILWLVVPQGAGEEVKIDREQKVKEFAEDVRKKAESVAGEIKQNKGWFSDRRTILALIIIFIGAVLLLKQLVPIAWLKWHLIWPIILIIIGIILIFKTNRK